MKTETGSGEFLHLYVDIPGARAFFEFVEQPGGGYDGDAVQSIRRSRTAAQAAPAFVGGGGMSDAAPVLVAERYLHALRWPAGIARSDGRGPRGRGSGARW